MLFIKWLFPHIGNTAPSPPHTFFLTFFWLSPTKGNAAPPHFSFLKERLLKGRLRNFKQNLIMGTFFIDPQSFFFLTN